MKDLSSFLTTEEHVELHSEVCKHMKKLVKEASMKNQELLLEYADNEMEAGDVRERY